MAKKLKEYYDGEYLEFLAELIGKHCETFDEKKFFCTYKSVANHLNDLYKEDREKFYEIINAWKKEGLSKECEWIIKHDSRNIEKNA